MASTPSLPSRPMSAQPANEPPSLVVRLYEEHFTIGAEAGVHHYDGPLRPLLEAIVDERLPAEFIDLFDSAGCKFQSGALIVDVLDFRSSTLASHVESNDEYPPHVVHRARLKPNGGSLWADVMLMHENGKVPWTEDRALDVEKRIMNATLPPICLEPTTEVVRVANLANFDRVKSNIVIGRKRTRDEAKERKEEESEVLFVEAKRGEFAPSFRRAQFVEDWRRKRQLADNEPLFFGDNKKRAKPSSSLSWNTYRLVRSLRWERKEGQTADGKERRLYYIFNAYEKGAGSGQFIGVLRWGTVPDTAIDGNTIAFALGNKEAALAYISGQLSFWTDRSTMTTDWSHQGFVASRPPTTLGEGAGSGPAAAAAAAAAAAVMASAPSTTLLPLNAILASGGQSLADANPSGSPTAGIMAPPTTTQQSNLVSSVLQQLNPARTAAGIAAAAGTVAPDLSSIMQLSRSGELGTGGPLNVSGAFRPSFGGATAGTVQPLLRARGAQGNPLQGQGNPLQQALLQGAPGAALSNPATLQALLAKSKGNPPF